MPTQWRGGFGCLQKTMRGIETMLFFSIGDLTTGLSDRCIAPYLFISTKQIMGQRLLYQQEERSLLRLCLHMVTESPPHSLFSFSLGSCHPYGLTPFLSSGRDKPAFVFLRRSKGVSDVRSSEVNEGQGSTVQTSSSVGGEKCNTRSLGWGCRTSGEEGVGEGKGLVKWGGNEDGRRQEGR